MNIYVLMGELLTGVNVQSKTGKISIREEINMPLIPLSCPSCGGSLTVDSDQDAAVCDYCGKPYIVKDAIVKNYISNVFNIDTVNVYGGNEFVIRAGVLVEYNGEKTDVIIPDNVRSISPDAFSGTAIETVTIPDGIKEIPPHAFENCSELREVVFPDTLETIGANAFYNCSKLKEIIIPESVKKIDNYAFQKCHSLEYVKMPKTDDGSYISGVCSFVECENIKKVDWEDHYLKDVELFFNTAEGAEITNLWSPPEGKCPYCGQELIQKQNGRRKCKSCGYLC